MDYKIFYITLLWILFWIVILVISLITFDKLTKFSIYKEIIEDQNIALSIIIAAMIIWISIIIASALHG